MLLMYNYVLLKIGTWYSKHVEESNNIWRINNIQCITLVVLYGYLIVDCVTSQNNWIFINTAVSTWHYACAYCKRRVDAATWPTRVYESCDDCSRLARFLLFDKANNIYWRGAGWDLEIAILVVNTDSIFPCQESVLWRLWVDVVISFKFFCPLIQCYFSRDLRFTGRCTMWLFEIFYKALFWHNCLERFTVPSANVVFDLN